MQSAAQLPAQPPAEASPSKPPWQYRRGQSGNPSGSLSRAAKLARRDALIAEWTESIGGPASLTAAELALLHQAAGLVLCSPRTAEDRVRCANLVSRIMVQVGLVNRRGKRPVEQPKVESYAELSARIAAEQGARRAQELAEDEALHGTADAAGEVAGAAEPSGSDGT